MVGFFWGGAMLHVGAVLSFGFKFHQFGAALHTPQRIRHLPSFSFAEAGLRTMLEGVSSFG